MNIVSTGVSPSFVAGQASCHQSPGIVFPQLKIQRENRNRDSCWKNGDLDQYANKLIQHKAHQLVGKAGFTESDLDDLIQEMWVDLLQRMPQFDSKRAKQETFITRVVNHKIVAILRHRRAEMRHYGRKGGSLSKAIHDEDRPVNSADMLDEHIHAFRTGQATRSRHDHAQLQFDLTCVTAKLPAGPRRLCRSLMVATVSQVARDRGIPRSTLQESVCRLRQRFKNAGLKNYL